MDPLLFSVADAAPLLAIKETKLRELIDAGRIATVQLGAGGDTYIRRCDLEAFVAGLPARRKGEPDRLPAVTNRVTNGRQPERRLTARGALPTVNRVPYEPMDEGESRHPL